MFPEAQARFRARQDTSSDPDADPDARDEKVKERDLTANPSLLRKQLLHPADLASFEADFDAMWMRWRTCQNVLNNASCKGPATLVLLLYNLYL